MRRSDADPGHLDLDEVCALLAAGGSTQVDALRGRLESGELCAVLSRSADGPAVIAANALGTWRQLPAAHGPESALLLGLEELRGSSEALIWDEGTVAISAEKLDALGFRLLERQVFTQRLDRVPGAEPQETGFELVALTDAVRGHARRLFGRTHAMSVEGLYVTLPQAPTAQQCEAAFEGYLAGDQGAPVEPACVVARSQGRVVGVICCAESGEPGTAILLGLAVDPAERGRGLARVLVRRAQGQLRAHGFERMLFLTTDRNAPVHRLFTSEEVVSVQTFPARLWLRDRPGAPGLRRA